MLGIITPLMFGAVIVAATLGISFIIVEMTLRLIARMLGAQVAPVSAIRRPINVRAGRERKAKTRLQVIPAR